MASIGRHLVHTASWERKTGGSDWEGDDYAPAAEIPCRRETRARVATGAGGEEIRSHARYMVGPEHAVSADDRLDGEIVEAVDEQVNGSGTVVGRICYVEA